MQSLRRAKEISPAVCLHRIEAQIRDSLFYSSSPAILPHIMSNSSMKQSTQCVHAGGYDDATGGLTTPIFTATAYRYPNTQDEVYYPRYFNLPSQRAVAMKICALENGEDALVLSSGMAAITSTLLALLKSGDHAVFQNDLYGGTHHFVAHGLPRLGIQVSVAADAAGIAKKIRKNTRLIFIETPSNPLLKVVDIAAIAKLGAQHRITTIVDNTFASPINQNPLTMGMDIVIHSGTKYLNGHSDVNCGAVVSSKALIQQVTQSAASLGGTLDVNACYLLERGLKTLALRVKRQNENAMEIARFLKRQRKVIRVNYPGLTDHPTHEIALRQMRGFGGMLSFEIKGSSREVATVLKRLKYITPAISLGGVESLICLPCQTSHAKLSREDRRRLGISDTLMRLSLGIEDVEDLREDLEQAIG
jgi:cystathionine beta-lyase